MGSNDFELLSKSCAKKNLNQQFDRLTGHDVRTRALFCNTCQRQQEGALLVLQSVAFDSTSHDSQSIRQTLRWLHPSSPTRRLLLTVQVCQNVSQSLR